MTPYTASLVWRCRIATAAKAYEDLLVVTNPNMVAHWGGIYGVEDIQRWAKERVNSILLEAAELWPVFSGDAQLAQSALNAARPSLENLVRLGWSGIAQTAITKGLFLDSGGDSEDSIVS